MQPKLEYSKLLGQIKLLLLVLLLAEKMATTCWARL